MRQVSKFDEKSNLFLEMLQLQRKAGFKGWRSPRPRPTPLLCNDGQQHGLLPDFLEMSRVGCRSQARQFKHRGVFELCLRFAPGEGCGQITPLGMVLGLRVCKRPWSRRRSILEISAPAKSQTPHVEANCMPCHAHAHAMKWHKPAGPKSSVRHPLKTTFSLKWAFLRGPAA